jgi:hypothetical protein
MVAELSYKQSVIRDLVNHSMLFVDSSGPVTREAMFEGLRFTDTFKWFSLGFLD